MLSDIINIFVGLAMTFGTVALIVSALTEGLSSALKWRSTTLLSGLKELLNDPALTGLAGAVLNHAAVNPRAPGTNTKANTAPSKLPSYIPPTQFASALIDVIKHLPTRTATGLQASLVAPDEKAQATPDATIAAQSASQVSLADGIARVADPQMNALLSGIHQRVGGDIDRFHAELAQWFDNSMDRVAGEYKRKTQLVSFLIALSAAVSLNLDAFHIAYEVWGHPALTANAALFQTPPDNATKALSLLRSDFPFGWPMGTYVSISWDHPLAAILSVLAVGLGWLTTAIATLFGAPFWFDTLQRFVSLGGTGPKPTGTNS